ncbi:MAG: AAA family ATPase [Caldibacillus debilis]|nr:MAG: AAA family ATPase [Caldibacillus debilis]
MDKLKLNPDTQYIKRITLKRERIDSYDEYPLNLPVVRNLRELDLHPNVTYMIGENGMGKSTLLEGIAVGLGFNPEGGTRNYHFSTFDTHSRLHEFLRIAKGVYRPKDGFFLRAESFYNVATYVEELGPEAVMTFGGKSLHRQSHGESFFSVFLHRFQGKGLYILDEPEAALSPLRQISMLRRIHELVNRESQFIISTHSPILMAYPEAKIFELTEEGIFEKRLEETNHYALMKQFFDDKDRLLHHLLQ